MYGKGGDGIDKGDFSGDNEIKLYWSKVQECARERDRMNTVWIRDVEVGAGRPKIVVPIVGTTQAEILAQSDRLQGVPLDIVEWRADFYCHLLDEDKLLETLTKLRTALGNTPILFTIRTRHEGGEGELTDRQYIRVNQIAARSGMVDAVDVEALRDEEMVRENIAAIHAAGVVVVGSNHNFDRTPSEDELVSRLCVQQELGCDILKIAVMPKTKRDVLTLLSATERMYSEHAHRPLVTMSMASMGVLSRFCGEVFGSSMTFGAVGKGSAPGQVPVAKLDQVLGILHDCM